MSQFTEAFLGEIRMFAGDYAPEGWAFCNGQLIPISENQALYAVIGLNFGGDGRTNFALPDLRGRVPMHFGQGPGLSRFPIGAKIGTETVQLDINEMPAHTHSVNKSASTASIGATEKAATTPNPKDAVLANVNGKAGRTTAVDVNVYAHEDADCSLKTNIDINVDIEQNGNSGYHNNIQPSLVVNYIIALEGTFPPRNR